MGLLDFESNLSPLQMSGLNQGLLGLAAGLLQGSGPSVGKPVGFGQALGLGLQGFQQGQGNALKQALQNEQIKSAMQSNALNKMTYDYYMGQGDPTGMAPGKGPAIASSMNPAAPAGGLLGNSFSTAQPAIIPTDAGPVNIPQGGAAPSANTLDVGGSTIRFPDANAPAGSPAPTSPIAVGSTFGAAPAGISGATPAQGSSAPIFDRGALAARAAGMFRVPGLGTQAVELLKLANQGMPEGAYYGQDGALHATPGYNDYVAGKSTAETLGKNLETRDANGNVVALPGSQQTAATGAGMISGAQANAQLPAELAKIGATGAQTRANQQNAAGYEMQSVPMQTGTDAGGQPVFTTVQVPKAMLPNLFKNGPIPGMQTLTPVQQEQLKAWSATQKPMALRNDLGTIGIPGAGVPAPNFSAVTPGQSAVPSLPNGAGGATGGLAGAPAPAAEASPTAGAPGVVVQGKTTAQVESEKKRADQMGDWQKAAVGNQNLLQQLKSLSDVSQFYNTGKLSPDATNAGSWLASLGADPSTLLGDPSKGEEFNKIASNFLTQQVSNLSSAPAHAAFGTIGTGMMSGDKRPETNHDITAQLMARLRWENDLAAESAQKFPNGVPSTSFITDFTKTHPTQAYLDQARSDIPPFAGMAGSSAKPISVMGDKPPAKPLPNRWYSGKNLPGGRAMYLGNDQWEVPSVGGAQ